MKVAICDDEQSHIDSIKSKIELYDAEIYEYTSAKKLLSESFSFDIAFLDIEMDEMNGFEVANAIYDTNRNCILVFFTSHYELASRGYEFNAFRFILKQEPTDVIQRQINDTFKEYLKRNKKITVTYKASTSCVAVRDIIYLESANHTITLKTASSDYKWYMRLKDIEEEFLKYEFIRCHKSFMVNFNYIKSIIDDKEFELLNGMHIPIGRTYRDFSKSMYARFHMRGGLF